MGYGKGSYTSYVDACKQIMTELERQALKEVAKEIRKKIKERVPVRTGTLKKNIGSWVKKAKKTGDVSLQIGVYSQERAKRKHYTYAYHAHLVEFGTKHSKANPFLRNTVLENVDLIRLIQGKYIKEIENENRARGLINEEEEVADD